MPDQNVMPSGVGGAMPPVNNDEEILEMPSEDGDLEMPAEDDMADFSPLKVLGGNNGESVSQPPQVAQNQPIPMPTPQVAQYQPEPTPIPQAPQAQPIPMSPISEGQLVPIPPAPQAQPVPIPPAPMGETPEQVRGDNTVRGDNGIAPVNYSQEQLLQQAARPGVQLRVPPKVSDGTMQDTIMNAEGQLVPNKDMSGAFTGINTQSRADIPQNNNQIQYSVPGSNSDAPVAPVYPPKTGSKLGLVAFLGLILIIGIGGLGAYVMASGGTRIPFVSKFVTGLADTAKDVGVQVDGILKANQSYYFQSQVVIDAGSESTSSTTAQDTQGNNLNLYGSSLLPNQTSGTVNYTSFENISAGKVNYTNKDLQTVNDYKIEKTIEGRLGLTQVTESESGGWNVLPDMTGTSSGTLTLVSGYNQNLLYGLFNPVDLAAVLSGINKENSYEKVSGQNISQYKVGFDLTKLTGILPSGATWNQLDGVMKVAWNSKKLVSLSLIGKFTYVGKIYDYSNVIQIGDKPSVVVQTELDKVNAAALEGGTVSDVVTMIKQMGILSVDKIPQSAVDTIVPGLPESNIEPTATPTATPTAIPTTIPSAVPTIIPTPTPTPVSSAITPSGQSSVSPVTYLANPSKPSSVVTSAGRTRDIQRKADLASIKSALTAYKLANGSYPVANDFVQVASDSGFFYSLVSRFITAMPLDPLTSTYWYSYKSDGSTFSLRAVAENSGDSSAVKGATYYYFEVLGQ